MMYGVRVYEWWMMRDASDSRFDIRINDFLFPDLEKGMESP